MIKLDVGCGGKGTIHSGFVGIDVWPIKEGITPREQGASNAYVVADARKRIPYAEGTVDFVLCSHMLEHLTRPDALRVMAEIKRVLKPGYCAVLFVPDLKVACQAYLEHDEDFWRVTYANGTPVFAGDTYADKFMDLLIGMGEHGHQYAYDHASLQKLAADAGFEKHNTLSAISEWRRRSWDAGVEAWKS